MFSHYYLDIVTHKKDNVNMKNSDIIVGESLKIKEREELKVSQTTYDLEVKK